MPFCGIILYWQISYFEYCTFRIEGKVKELKLRKFLKSLNDCKNFLVRAIELKFSGFKFLIDIDEWRKFDLNLRTFRTEPC